ncbi:MAG: sulfatase [Verrucomicrobia bacterium]|nr:sulfatase [Verrucomicrobiota bacterium]
MRYLRYLRWRLAARVGFGLLLLLGAWSGALASARDDRPNIVVIFCDDLGWADVGCFGARGVRTPAIDRLAREGTRFTSFYVAQPVCSASRAALMTGCYPNRLGIHGALFPEAKIGLNTNEVTLARMLKSQGYATAIYGKWHLGRPAEFLPPRHGFDDYFGLPYSNDMWPNHPSAKPDAYPPLPLIELEAVKELMPDQRFLTRRYTDRAVEFIERHRERPFFLYLAHSMPHVPLHASPAFEGRSPAGLYGDVVEEIDASVSTVLATLDRLRLTQRTWVIFTSDNGPWHSYGSHAGSAGPFREGKGSVFEGGIRVPCVMRWPAHIAAGRTCDEPLMTIDLLPTIARRLRAPLPRAPIDGVDAWRTLAGRGDTKDSPRTYYFYYGQGELQAMRSGRWKLHFPHVAQVMLDRPGCRDVLPAPYSRLMVGLELYDLDTDPGETVDVAASHPGVIQRLQGMAEIERDQLGDSLLKRIGKGIRPAGRAQ